MINTNRAQGAIGGDVNIDSLQDTATYDSKQKNMGFSADLDMTTGEGSSLSVNGGKTNLNADYKGVGEQSGLFTGDGGLDLTAGGKTTLIGGAITTTEAARDAGRNRYTSADGIKTQDINNTTSYDGDAIQAGLSLGQTDNKPQASMNGLGYGSDSDSDSSVTRAGITGIAGSQDITTDNRAEYAGILENSFDASQVNQELGAQTQITQAFGKEAPKALAEFAQHRIDAIKANPDLSIDEKLTAIAKWDEGGIYRVAAHTALGALGTGSVEGALTTGGVAAAPTLDDVQAKLAKALIDKGMSEDIANGTASGVISLNLLGAGTAAGLDTSSTVTATNVDVNNRQLHPQEKELAKVLFEKAKKQGWKRADGKSYTLQEIEDALRWANSSKYNEKYNDDVTIRVGNNAKGAAIDKVMYDNGVGADFESRLKKAVLEGLMTSAVLYPHVFGFEPDFVMTSGGVAGATQGVSGSSAVRLHNGQGYSSGNYDIGVNIDKSKIESFSVDGSVVYGFILDEPRIKAGETNRSRLTANTLQGSSFTGTSCYLGACGAIVTTRADRSTGIPSRKVLMLGLGQTLGKGGTTEGSISGGVMNTTDYNTIENIDKIKEQVRKIKLYR